MKSFSINGKFRLGLDIGIASVGWAIVDEKDEIINAGVRLFPEGGSKNSMERRIKRASRRLLRRRKHRIERVRKLLLDYKIIDNLNYDFYTNETTPYELRAKGIYNFLTKRELAISLLNLVKKRGIHNFEIKVKEEGEEKGTKEIILRNEERLGERFVCELQLEKLYQKNIDLENGSVRGKRNVFRTEDYVKEARAILNKQKEFYSEIDDEFIEKYIRILEGRREYFTGPGTPSIYGWKDEEEWIENLFGRCTYFPEEIRMCKNSYTAELFNLLNDLNNLKIDRAENIYLTKIEKEQLIELFKKQNPTLTRIAKAIGVKEIDISGYRIDKNEKPKFTELSVYKNLNGIFGIEDVELMDEISKILTIYQTNDKIIEHLNELGLEVDNNQIEKLNKLSFSGSHALSKKAMRIILDDLLETHKNQMQLFTEKGLTPYKMDFSGQTKIPKSYIDDWILSPVVKRSFSQTISLINAIHKKYGIPEEIVIEMAREKNSDEKKERLKKLQREGEKNNQEIKELLEGVSYKKEKGVFQKIKFWKEQNGECAYSGDKIPLNDLLNRPELYEIDHILPRSISFDDSQNNKVLVKREENQNKRNMSPFQYLSITGRYEEFKKRIKASSYFNKKKRENLLFEEDLSKYSRNFIARNLVDTRYVTREILGLLKKYYSDNNFSVKIKSIRGSVTAQFRREWNFPKNRELSHAHHAQDALIILSAERILNQLKYVKNYYSNEEVDLTTGEILTEKDFRKIFKYECGRKIKQYTDFKFSHFIDKKPNRQLSDETIYSTRIVNEIDSKGKETTSEYIISKLKDIYSKNNDQIKKFFKDEKNREKLLMFHHDRKTFDELLKIYETYKNETNPFWAYYNEHGLIRKYSKNGKGAPVKTIKYRDSKLGNCLNLSHKYNVKNGKKVVMLSIPGYRADVYKKGESYKFVKVDYLMLEDKGSYYQLNMNKYNKEKTVKEIDEEFEFQFSLYKGDIFEIGKGEETERWRFKSVGNDKRNIFEVDFIDRFSNSIYEPIKDLQKLLKENKNVDVFKFKTIVEEKLGELPECDNIKEYIEKFKRDNTRKYVRISINTNYMRKVNADAIGIEYKSVEKFVSKISI